MKNLKFLLLTLLSLVMFSCSKSDDNTSTTTTNPNNINYKIIFSGTVLTNYCATISAPYHISADFISNNNVIKSYNYTGNNTTQIGNVEILKGDEISIKLKSTDFDKNNKQSGRGISIQEITVTVINNDTGIVLLTKKDILFYLAICDDSVYETEFIYYAKTNSYNTKRTHWSF